MAQGFSSIFRHLSILDLSLFRPKVISNLSDEAIAGVDPKCLYNQLHYEDSVPSETTSLVNDVCSEINCYLLIG